MGRGPARHGEGKRGRWRRKQRPARKEQPRRSTSQRRRRRSRASSTLCVRCRSTVPQCPHLPPLRASSARFLSQTEALSGGDSPPVHQCRRQPFIFVPFRSWPASVPRCWRSPEEQSPTPRAPLSASSWPSERRRPRGGSSSASLPRKRSAPHDHGGRRAG